MYYLKVMYMHYLLGQRISAECSNKRDAMKKARRTFILALDGDVDFKPEALIHLIDMMKRSLTVGASCGRIHPNGSGNCNRLLSCYKLEIQFLMAGNK
jgi:chitin synthase